MKKNERLQRKKIKVRSTVTVRRSKQSESKRRTKLRNNKRKSERNQEEDKMGNIKLEKQSVKER